MVTAYASKARLVLAQKKVEERSNQITAIPKLINELDFHGATITLDAMGCQKSIAKHIVESGGDYVFPAKGKKNTLYQKI